MDKEEKIEDIRSAHREAEEKYCYYVLSVTASCLAFTLYQTRDATLQIHHLLLALAVLSWGISFTYGITFLKSKHRLIMKDFDYHSSSNLVPRDVAVRMYEDIQKDGYQSQRVSRYQYIFLLIGALMFIAWHVYEMYLRSSPVLPGWLQK